MLLIARVAALALSVSTFVFLFVHHSRRADNLFLVPGLVLCAWLGLAAARRSVPLLIGAFGYAAGVLSVSVASYAVDGRLGLPSLVGVLGSVGLLVALSAVRPQERLREREL